ETVLTMTYVAGDHMNEFLAREPGQERRNHFGQLLWDFVHDQIASNYCTLHADAHPGNFLFRDDGRLGVIDFGCVKRFPQEFRNDMIRLWNARIHDDEAAIEDLLHKLDILHGDMNAATRTRVKSFFERFGKLIVQPYRSDTFDFGDDAFFNELKECFQEGSKLRETSGSHHFIFINKVLVGLFGIMNQLKPKLNTVQSRTALHESVQELPTG
ncbi:MAG: AarF/UbiB family protein, partial [Bacteroidota bacterium]